MDSNNSEIEKIRILDDKIFKELKIYFPKTTSSKFKKKYPNTYLLINYLDSGATFIKNAIFDGCETDGLYGIKILYRSLIEHFLRFQYLFINWGMTKSDEFASNYIEYNEAGEVLYTIRAALSVKKLDNPDYKIKNWDILIQKHPKFINKTKNEIKKESDKYSLKNIIKFINNHYKDGKYEMSEQIAHFIIEYSDLSSYVHGGINSYHEMIDYRDEEKRIKEYNRICGLSFQLSNSIKLFSLLMMIQTDKELFSSHYLNIDEFIKEINKI